MGPFFQGLASTWQDFSVEVEDFVASGDRVCVIGRADGTLNGTKTGYGFVHAWTVRTGRSPSLTSTSTPSPEMLAG